MPPRTGTASSHSLEYDVWKQDLYYEKTTDVVLSEDLSRHLFALAKEHACSTLMPTGDSVDAAWHVKLWTGRHGVRSGLHTALCGRRAAYSAASGL